MPIHFSPVIDTEARQVPEFDALSFIDLAALGVHASPLAVLDDFRVRKVPFSAHAHAGFAAVTYVFEDSQGSLRSRTSTGVDVVVGPGGLVWTHAGSGVIHEEVPAVLGTQLHGLQLFVNLSSRTKLSPPQVLHLDGDQVPVWRSETGSRVRVVVGSFRGVTSPLAPPEPFALLDIEISDAVTVDLAAEHNTVVYVLTGTVLIDAGTESSEVRAGQAVSVCGDRLAAHLQPQGPAHLLLLSGARIDEAIVAEGPFIMNDRLQLQAAIARYRSGEMGGLSPIEG